MPNALDLKGKKVQDTYTRVVQIDANKLYDGQGNLIIDVNNIAQTSNIITYTSGESIDRGMCVYMNTDGRVSIYKSSSLNGFGKFIGIANTAANVDEEIDIVIGGAFISDLYFQAGEIYYVGIDGYLTITPDFSQPFSQQIGIGINSDAMQFMVLPAKKKESTGTFTESSKIVDLVAGDTSVLNLSKADNYSGAFLQYVLTNGVDQRSGQVIVSIINNQVDFSELCTSDIGNTDSILFNVLDAGTEFDVKIINVPDDSFSLKLIYKAI